VDCELSPDEGTTFPFAKGFCLGPRLFRMLPSLHMSKQMPLVFLRWKTVGGKNFCGSDQMNGERPAAWNAFQVGVRAAGCHANNAGMHNVGSLFVFGL